MRKGNHKLAWWLFIAMILLSASSLATAKSVKLEPLDAEGKRTWIIELTDPPLVRFDGRNAVQARANRLEATSPLRTGRKLDLLSPQAREYAGYLDDGMEAFLQRTENAIGARAEIKARFRNLLNGVSLRLTESEAEQIRKLPGVKSLLPNEIFKLESDASPELVGATKIWSGESGNIPSRGEGIVVGIIDTGINWDHSSFADPAPDGYKHTNPFGQHLGLCSDAQVQCNDKLIGIYDFTDEGSKGKGTNFHGSWTASIAAGNRINATVHGEPTQMSGIAPRANIISYKVCVEDDPDTPDEDEGGCESNGISQALEQALSDGVDVVNLSIGGGSSNPWNTYSRLFLDLMNAGIFSATSASNDGPAPASVKNPGLAPWLLAVAATTHSRTSGSTLTDLSGGNAPAPEDFTGAGLAPVNGSSNGVGPADIVWAGDYGNALCGTGESQGLVNCNAPISASNPFAPGTFDGKIVVCERGEYGRVEKGLNVMLAGAVGYVLINNDEYGETVVADNHCVPGIHLGYSRGQELKSWLTSGSGHTGTIGPFSGLIYNNAVADLLGSFSSQGPNPAVPGVLAPNISAPGVNVLGAGKDNDELAFANGTSASSPNVAGGGALLLSAEPGLTPIQINSMLQSTATTQVSNYLGLAANPFEMGTGRIQLDQALAAGLYMHVTGSEFLSANPSTGGDASTLNLPELVQPDCRASCQFTRRVTDRVGGGSWTVTAENFPAGVNVTVSPSSFTLSSGATQTLDIKFELGLEILGQWSFGEIKLTSDGLPDQHLTAALYSDGGDLPSRWAVNSDGDGGFRDFTLSGLAELPAATFSTGGLVKPSSTTTTLTEDPTNREPFDNNNGVFKQWIKVPEGSLWLHARTPSSTASDVDLYVGRDFDGDRRADENETLCIGGTPGDREVCDIMSPEAGDYWILVQNFTASTIPDGDDITLISALSAPTGDSRLAASGPGITESNQPFSVRLSWDNINALPGEEWLGAVSVGSQSNQPDNIGVIQVRYTRTGISEARTFPLMEGTTHRLALDGNAEHDRIFIDVPAGASSLTVAAQGANDDQNNGLMLELVRLDFDESLTNPPFASAPGNAAVVASASGSGPEGPELTVSGQDLQPGRWYAVLSNSNVEPSAIEIRADVEFSDSPVAIHPGLWQPGSRPGLGQGYEYNFGGGSRSLIWYTYDDDGQPAWYIAGNPEVTGDIWTAPLQRVTNDGADQQLAPVGQVSVSMLAKDDAMYSFTLFGVSGSDRMIPISALTCPRINGSEQSYTGLWYRGVDGLGGASILMNASTQAQIHYLFDAVGRPRWLFAQDEEEPAPTVPEIPFHQFSGYCAVCPAAPVSSIPVGVLGRSFSSETEGNWTLDYMFEPPLVGSAERTDQVIKLTDTIDCE